jgi:hypothetical protein
MVCLLVFQYLFDIFSSSFILVSFKNDHNEVKLKERLRALEQSAFGGLHGLHTAIGRSVLTNTPEESLDRKYFLFFFCEHLKLKRQVLILVYKKKLEKQEL